MTTMLLIRHGQASFGSGDYDRLCDNGVQQARVLGGHLAREQRKLTTVVSGTLRRQQDTALHALNAMDRELPLEIDCCFDEYSSDDLLQAYLPLAAAQRPDIRRDVLREDRKQFQAALATAVEMWITGVDGFTGESWRDFNTRVRSGLDLAIARSGKRDTVAVFTSGGVIAAAVGFVLGLAPQTIVNLH
jgi:broad specificity phosphatase PhoE